ncbi:uncharacterized protein RCC_05076 [Ramularia collo-cygni]|uniref:Uncharacterized protein n=1 Tax=Ramularia collo-cygni TaxID=112498 RepID=A0A2D3V170_9PEZI|nr:uncharacterized protein RCC_05076 [Ramularia collo-cygni]CZT19230.1 uncharacterized protein RCC_05076 [Ramularia collo-cygni]
MAQSNIHSTGRGGAGNIGPDDNVYVAGDITREGIHGSSNAKEYSNGRGGAGNIIPATEKGASIDAVPESATRHEGSMGYDKFHTGRSGAGNVYKEKYGGHSNPQTPEQKPVKEGGIVEKVKHVMGLDKREKTPEVEGK